MSADGEVFNLYCTCWRVPCSRDIESEVQNRKRSRHGEDLTDSKQAKQCALRCHLEKGRMKVVVLACMVPNSPWRMIKYSRVYMFGQLRVGWVGKGLGERIYSIF